MSGCNYERGLERGYELGFLAGQAQAAGLPVPKPDFPDVVDVDATLAARFGLTVGSRARVLRYDDGSIKAAWAEIR